MNKTDKSTDAYERLADVLDATPQGFPRMKSGVEIKLLKLVFTPEERSSYSNWCSLSRRFHLQLI